MRLIYFDTPHYAVACNHKVFSSNIALAVIGSFYPELLQRTKEATEERKKRNRWHGLVPTLMDDKLNKPVVLLFADPVVKFFSACREDRISYYNFPLQLARKKRWRSFHFWPQCRFFTQDKYPVLVFDAVRHLENFYNIVGLDKQYLPTIKNKELSNHQKAFLLNELDELIEIYEDDFSVHNAISIRQEPVEFSKLNVKLNKTESYRIDGSFITPLVL
jgi:hypothetical protein